MKTLEKRIDVMQSHLETLLENCIDIALSDETVEELKRLERCMQWTKRL